MSGAPTNETAADHSIRRFALDAERPPILPMALGGSWYSKGMRDAELLDAMAAAYEHDIRHFDTGARYSGGHSEELVGRFVGDKRDQVFLASKSDTNELSATAMLAEVEGSLRRLQVDHVDLYYIHWPRAGRDIRPMMEGLERARAQGKVGAIGVSNFSVAQMQQVQEVGRVDAHQLGYNLLWRYADESIIPTAVTTGSQSSPTAHWHTASSPASSGRTQA